MKSYIYEDKNDFNTNMYKLMKEFKIFSNIANKQKQ